MNWCALLPLLVMYNFLRNQFLFWQCSNVIVLYLSGANLSFVHFPLDPCIHKRYAPEIVKKNPESFYLLYEAHPIPSM